MPGPFFFEVIMAGEWLEFGYLSGNVMLSAAPARFLKEIIRVGRYRHPQRAGETLDITEERLRRWVDNFYAAPAKVWVPYRHSTDPQDNTGWVEDLFLDDGRLYAVLRITDEGAATLLRDGTVADVSVAVEPDFADMTGRRWGEVIRHVALTVDPYIRNQSGFIPLGPAEGEKKGGADVPLFKYAYVDEETGEGFYPHHADDGAVDMDAVRRALAALAAADLAADIKEKIRAHLLAHLREAGEAEPAAVAATASAEADDTLQLEARVAALTRRNRELRRELSRLAEESRRRREEAAAQEVAALVAAGKITPALAPKVQALLAAGERQEILLETGPTNVARVVRELLAALPAAVDFGEHFALAAPTGRVPLSPAEKRLLAALGVNEEDYRRYGTT